MIPYILLQAGEKFCGEETLNGIVWPKTPDRDTVINQKCEAGRVGYKSRTCESSNWQPVFSACVTEELNAVSNAAEVSAALQIMTLESWGSIWLLFLFLFIF